MAKRDAFSPLVLDELYAAGDERFLDHLIKFHDPKKLAAIAERWSRDTRPWAQRVMLQYLEQLPGSFGHEVVVKRLFKRAEQRNDDVWMGRFAVAFDRLIRRKQATRWRYDSTARQSWQEDYLQSTRDVLPKPSAPMWAGTPPSSYERLFSYHTRHYLRRRAWRYFRRMGHQRPRDYVGAVAGMLKLYGDADLATGERFLDSRTLLHACFRGSDVLNFTPGHVKLMPGRSLAELSAAPTHEAIWKQSGAANVLLELVASANARPVRAWAVQVFRRFHFDAPPTLAPAQLLPLLDHADELVQQLAADLLERATGLESLTIDDWLRLLQTRNPAALETITRVMRRHVTADRLSIEQAVHIATAAPVPVARLGLDLIKGKTIGKNDHAALARLADAQSASAAGEITSWALPILGDDAHYEVDRVVRFFDALLRPTRQAAWAWLANATSPRAVNDPALWSRLIETPYDDVRLHLVDALKHRASLPGVESGKLGPGLWAPVLLGIHRGGRAKLIALRQVSDAIAGNPDEAKSLLPVLAVAIRSVRLPEARHGLAAIVRAVDVNPSLAESVQRHFPELELGEVVCR